MNAEARRRRRLEDLRHALTLPQESRRDAALLSLASEIGTRTGGERLEAVCALLNYPPEADSANVPLSALRLYQHLTERLDAEEEETNAQIRHQALGISPTPNTQHPNELIGQSVNAVLNESLDTLRALLPLQGEAIAAAVRSEIEVCLSLLKTVQAARLAGAADTCMRVLRVFRAEAARSQSVLSRPTTLLRDAACRAIGAISPDSLFLFWYTLGCPDPAARRDLLPALDYLRDPRATPYLLRLLERRGQWADSEMVGWFVLRAFEHLGDRRAVPALRQLLHADDSNGSQVGIGTPVVSAELAREARRVIQSIERGRGWRDRLQLLRPALPPDESLLHPALETAAELERGEMVRPAHPESRDLLRPVTEQPETLLRPASDDTADSPARELLRPDEKPV
jgi:hypothetical protein